MLAAVGTTRVVAGHSVAHLAAYHAAFLAAAGVALVGAAVALTIRDADAAATMVRRQCPTKVSAARGPVTDPGAGLTGVAGRSILAASRPTGTRGTARVASPMGNAVMLDIDGVLIVSWEPLPGALETVEWLLGAMTSPSGS